MDNVQTISDFQCFVTVFFLFTRNNLLLLQVGFKSLSYEMQEQQPAYDSNALFGEEHLLLSLFTFFIYNTIYSLSQVNNDSHK